MTGTDPHNSVPACPVQICIHTQDSKPYTKLHTPHLSYNGVITLNYTDAALSPTNYFRPLLIYLAKER